MRTTFLLLGSLALVLGACSGKKTNAPPSLDKKLLTGKWKNNSDAQFLTAYEFGEDGTVKMTVRGMKEPVPGRYSWTGERTVDVEYSNSSDVQKAYEDAAKAYKKWVKDSIENKEMSDRAGPSMLGVVADKLPAKETFTVGIADPKYLVISNQNGATQNFAKVN